MRITTVTHMISLCCNPPLNAGHRLMAILKMKKISWLHWGPALAPSLDIHKPPAEWLQSEKKQDKRKL